MPYKQVKDILNRAGEFHEMLVEFYKGIKDVTEKGSARILVDYMANHEKALKDQLDQITTEQEQQIAQEWLKYEPDYATCKCFENLKIDKNTSVDDIGDIGLQLNQCLINLYHKMTEEAPTKGVEKLFLNLEAMEIAEKKKLARIRGM